MNYYNITNYTVENICNECNPAEIDVSVMIMFFNRPEHVKKVFENVKKARPSRLFLYQDGARENNTQDKEKMDECRRVVENIDWTCKVYKFYQTDNFGCDPSGYISRKWVFSLTDKCIILEDDCVPSVSFMRFCKEMLDKYEFDNRIYRISGQNILGEYTPYEGDYFFTKGGSIWGWASWKRVFDEWDVNYEFLNDSKVVNTLLYTYKDGGVRPEKALKTFQWHSTSGKEYFESIFFSARMLGSGLTIVPAKNMISNIGISEEATHGGTNIKLYTKNVQKAFFAPLYEVEFPLKHPKYILEDKRYEDLQSKLMGWRNNFLQRIAAGIEEKIRAILYK